MIFLLKRKKPMSILEETTCRVGQLSRITKVRVETIWRWCRKGVLVKGERIFLEHIIIGGMIVSSEEALDRLSAKCSKDRPQIESQPKQSKPNRAVKSVQAEKELKRLLAS
jgi:hypothetical protein